MKEEIWLLWGEWWRLPLRVTWPEEGARTVARVDLHPGMVYLRCWQEVIRERLAGIGAWPKGDGGLEMADGKEQPTSWFVTVEAVGEAMSLGPDGVSDPEELVQWSPDRKEYSLPMEGDVLVNPPGAPERRKFLTAFVERMGLMIFGSLEELEAFYFILCNFMATWMLEENQPVHLVWGKVFAGPYWPGWQKDVHERMKASKVAGPFNRRVLNALYNPRVRVGDKQAGIEIRSAILTMTKEWHKHARAGEALRRRVMREWKYVHLCDGRVKAMLPLLRENYEDYLQRREFTDFDHAFTGYTIRVGRGRIKLKRPGSKAGCDPQRNDIFLGVVANNQKKRAQRPEIMAGENEVVLPVRDLQPDDPDLRDERGNVVQPGQWIDPDARVLVSDAAQSPVEMGAVLEPGDGEQGGVAG